MKIAARAVIDMERKSFNLPIKRRYLVNPEIMMENLMKELDVALKAMSKAKTTEEKVNHSQIVRNLSESLGIFLNLANNMMENDPDEND